jgi:hypothetical protein
MMRITAGRDPLRLKRAAAQYQIVPLQAPFKCCSAISQLQHEVGIPNSWVGKVANFANLRNPKVLNNLIFAAFSNWHASCLETGTKKAKWS